MTFEHARISVACASACAFLACVAYVLQGCNNPMSAASVSGQGPDLGSAKTTRYWDCCKPSCSWPGKAAVSNPAATCAIDGSTHVGFNEQSGCDGGNAFMCADASPWYDPITQKSYATAAANIKGLGEDGWCCACYELNLDNGKPPVVVHVTNTGGDLAENHFDILVPGGGFGIFDACTRQWDATESVWGERYGGVMAAGKPQSSCDEFPDALKEGCRWQYDYLGDNPHVTSFYRVQCPAELTARSGCTRDDENNVAGGSGGGGEDNQDDGNNQGNGACENWCEGDQFTVENGQSHKDRHCGGDMSGSCGGCPYCSSNNQDDGSGGSGSSGGGGSGCCGWSGHCGECGDDGFCHKDATHCEQCSGTWLGGETKPNCR